MATFPPRPPLTPALSPQRGEGDRIASFAITEYLRQPAVSENLSLAARPLSLPPQRGEGSKVRGGNEANAQHPPRPHPR